MGGTLNDSIEKPEKNALFSHMRRLERREANRRERQRMAMLKSGFISLQQCLPMFPYENKMSKIDTLRFVPFMLHRVSSFDVNYPGGIVWCPWT